jgi:hypothetical protein
MEFFAAFPHFFLRRLWQLSNRQFLVSVVVGGLLLRLGMVAASSIPNDGDVYEQGSLARNITAGYNFSYHAWYIYTSLKPERREMMRQPPTTLSANQPPIYPFLLSWAYQFFGDHSKAHLAMMLLDCILGAVSALLVYWIVRESRLLDDAADVHRADASSLERAARTAAILFAVFLPGANAVVKVLAIVPSIFVALCAIWCLMRAVNQTNFRNAALLGFSLGLWTMMRSEALFLSAILMVTVMIIWMYKNGENGKFTYRNLAFVVRFASITVLCYAAVMLP